jgi:hypothetical protein
MDMRAYYRKIRDKEEEIREEWVVVRSLETPDGGIADRLTEVSRRNAAKMVVEGRAQLADSEEAERFHQWQRDCKAKADQEEAARRMQFTFVPAGEMGKGSNKTVKA